MQLNLNEIRSASRVWGTDTSELYRKVGVDENVYRAISSPLTAIDASLRKEAVAIRQDRKSQSDDEIFQKLAERAQTEALKALQRHFSENAPFGEQYYLGLLIANELQVYLGDIDPVTQQRNNPHLFVVNGKGDLWETGSKVRLSSVLLSFGAVAAATRALDLSAGRDEPWPQELNQLVSLAFVRDRTRLQGIRTPVWDKYVADRNR